MAHLKELSHRINKFDYWYAMSDDRSVYSKWSNEEREINKVLSETNDAELIELKKLITKESAFNTFGKHFEDLKESPKTKMKRSIFQNAWYYFKKGIYTSFSECLKAAWKAHKITKGLRKGSLSFSFRKATGEIRTAIGTLNAELFEFTAKGVRQESKPDAIKYFDLEKQSWRMFRIERLLNIAA